ncbi:MAG: hypothetical protein VX347_03700 [Bacteroidota bacterium]|nr:hypothetical protein [Bacteroidota bacterium]
MKKIFLIFLFLFFILFDTSAQSYIKYQNNPVIDTLSTIDANQIWTRWKTDPCVIHWDNDSLRMYYGTNNYGVQTQIGTAISKDGNNWIEKTDYPVLPTGLAGSWDELDVETPDVIYIPSNPDSMKYMLYYSGSQHDTIVLDTLNSGLYPIEIYQIGLAYSNDGVNFTKYNDPINDINPLYQNSDPVIRIPYTSGGIPDTINYFFSSVAEPSLIYDSISNTLKIWYIGVGCSNPNCNGVSDFRYRVLYSESIDGINWSSPILALDVGNSGDFDSKLIYAPYVIKMGVTYWLFYGGNTYSSGIFSLFSQKIGLAVSIDGINFTKISNNPIITNGSIGTWDQLGCNFPSAIIYKDTMRVYYSGMQDSLFNFNPNIGYFYLDSTFTSVYLNNNLDAQLIKVIDILGRESNQKKNTPLFYIYDDGAVEKRIIIE